MFAPDTPAAPVNGQAALDTLDWVRTFVSINTTSHVPNLSLVETVRDELAHHGVKATFIHGRRRDDRQQRKVAYGTEAGLFAQAAIPTIVCGSGYIEQAHHANEYVELEQPTNGERFCEPVRRQSEGAWRC